MVEAGYMHRFALIVDDDPVVRGVAAAALRALDFEVEEVESGESGLAAVDRRTPDLILLDVEMPGIDGFETCEALRARPETAQIPVLIATGSKDREAVDRAFQAGATDFIYKPLDWQLLQHRVRFMMRATDAFQTLRSTLDKLTLSEGRLAQAQHLARVGNWEWVLDENQVYWSPELYRILGCSPGRVEASMEALQNAAHGEDRELLEKAILQAQGESRGWSFDHRVETETGEERFVHHQAHVVRGGNGRPDRITGTVQDTTERRRTEERLRYLAHYDVLTALPNRQLLREHLNRTFSRVDAGSQSIAVLSLNLDRFKRINETLGHAVGDALLQIVAERLAKSVRTSDFVGSNTLVSRIGGDEFTIVLRNYQSIESIGQVCRRLLEAIRAPLVIGDSELPMTASIGIAVHPEDGEDVETLLRNADTALHHAKSRGRDSYEFFSSQMNEEVTRKLNMEVELRKIIEAGELEVRYQPQYAPASGQINGVEILARWPSPTEIPPVEFIPLAEETGLIGQLGEWVLEEACKQIRCWLASGIRPVRIAVNVSSVQIQKPGLVEKLADLLSAYDVPPELLELEITESALLSESDQVRATLEGLRELQVRLALDDFGTGFSSLSHLVKFPIDAIKIDQSFVSRIGVDREGEAIVSAVTALGHELGLRVCAEGVEREEQRLFLAEQHCDLLQGYLYSAPVDTATLEVLLRERTD